MYDKFAFKFVLSNGKGCTFIIDVQVCSQQWKVMYVHVIVFTVYVLLVVYRKYCLMMVANLSYFSLYQNLVFKIVK